MSDEEILKLWRDVDFEGSFSGVKTFQVLLKLNKNIDVSERRLYTILQNDPLFVMHQRGKKRISRRFYNLDYYGELVQSDLAFMFEHNKYKYFVVVYDCFSGKVFAEAIKDKTSDTVKHSLIRLLNKFETPITKFECDQGTEFNKFKQYCKENNIIFKFKYGQNKAGFAENIIQILKRRLYKFLRGTLNKNWPEVLEKVVEDYNNTPLKKIGYLKPNDILSKFDSKKVRDALQSNNIEKKDEPDYKTQIANQEQYEKSDQKRSKPMIRKGDYVFVNFIENKFDKGFDYQVSYFYFYIHFKNKIFDSLLRVAIKVPVKFLVCFLESDF